MISSDVELTELKHMSSLALFYTDYFQPALEKFAIKIEQKTEGNIFSIKLIVYSRTSKSCHNGLQWFY